MSACNNENAMMLEQESPQLPFPSNQVRLKNPSGQPVPYAHQLSLSYYTPREIIFFFPNKYSSQELFEYSRVFFYDFWCCPHDWIFHSWTEPSPSHQGVPTTFPQQSHVNESTVNPSMVPRWVYIELWKKKKKKKKGESLSSFTKNEDPHSWKHMEVK